MTETQVKIARFHQFFHEIPLFKGDFSLYNSIINKKETEKFSWKKQKYISQKKLPPNPL